MDKIYREENRIGTYNCDRSRVAKLSGILQLTQEAGRRQMALQKPSYDELQAEGKALMLSRLDLEIYDTIYFDEPLTVYSWPCESIRATWPRGYAIECRGKKMAEVASQWALVDMASRKVLKADEVDFSKYTMGEYNELYKMKLRIPKDAQLKKVGKHRVTYSNLDYNGHMNNTYYADILCDLIPEMETGKYRVKTFRVHYNREASLGDVISVMMQQTGEKQYLFKTVKDDGEFNIAAEIILTDI